MKQPKSSNTKRLIGIRQIGTALIPADKAPFTYGQGPERKPVVAIYLGGKRASNYSDVAIEVCGDAAILGQLAGVAHGAVESFGPEEVARFVHAYDQARAGQGGS